MKEQKRRVIIESAIKLFAKKGFYNTSVQGIVNDCGISKGAFYTYFSSKEELHIAIFQYYFEQMYVRSREIEKQKIDPREKMKLLLKVPFDQVNIQREFFMVYLREQSFSLNEDIREFMKKSQVEMLTRYERILKEIYGDYITNYTSDLILFIEGIQKSYLIAILFHNLHTKTELIPQFLMNRIDDMIKAFHNGEGPIIKNNFLYSVSHQSFAIHHRHEKVLALLRDMQDQLEVIQIPEEQKTGLKNVIEFLKAEIEKSPLDKYVFQGMLANLKEIKSFDIYREKIAMLLDVQLL